MSDQPIICPGCGARIELTKAVTQQVEDRLRRSFEAELKKRTKEIEAEHEERAAEEKERLKREALKKARESIADEVATLKEQVDEQGKKLAAAQKRELEMLKTKRALEEKEEQLALELERRLDKERKKIRESALQERSEEQALKDREHQKVIDDLKKQLEIAHRKAEQGSQQTQGEVAELELEDLLRSAFPLDKIRPVENGRRGGDIVQEVRDPTGKAVGSILWESKRAQSWSDKWVQKAKDDQRECKAGYSVIVSNVLPSGVSRIGLVGGVWATEVAAVAGLATALRHGLVSLAEARATLVDKDEKMAIVYEYFTGPKFRSRVESIVEVFIQLKRDHDAEKAHMERVWARREEHIERVIKNTVRLYGDVEGAVGNELPDLKVLELPAASTGTRSTPK